jgi:hypothetical protein
MGLRTRIAGLERKLGVRGGHRLCRCGPDHVNCVVWYEDAPQPLAQVRTCPDCGGVQEPLLIHVVYDSEASE